MYCPLFFMTFYNLGLDKKSFFLTVYTCRFGIKWTDNRGMYGYRLHSDPGEYVTFKQAQEANAKIKKGEKSEIAVFWKWIETENKDTGKEEKVPLLRYYRNDKSL
jgi:N-terminal domain of anti-restriction factor ArdC